MSPCSSELTLCASAGEGGAALARCTTLDALQAPQAHGRIGGAHVRRERQQAECLRGAGGGGPHSRWWRGRGSKKKERKKPMRQRRLPGDRGRGVPKVKLPCVELVLGIEGTGGAKWPVGQSETSAAAQVKFEPSRAHLKAAAAHSDLRNKPLTSFLPPRTRATGPKFDVACQCGLRLFVAWVVVGRYSICNARAPKAGCARVAACSNRTVTEPPNRGRFRRRPGSAFRVMLMRTSRDARRPSGAGPGLGTRHQPATQAARAFAVPVRGNLACPEVNRARVNAGPAWVAAGWEGWDGTDNNGACWDGVLSELTTESCAP
ncbi:hypothetical protein FB451DRAFT_1452267 [Mycena latifolia]|nr:hypothetical protein FB451DRAFT_1452267 [Mycena latifolia]